MTSIQEKQWFCYTHPLFYTTVNSVEYARYFFVPYYKVFDAWNRWNRSISIIMPEINTK